MDQFKIREMLKSIILEHLPNNPQMATRLFHGRGKKYSIYPFVNIDYLPPAILITTYRELSQDELISIIDVLHEINLVHQNYLFPTFVLQKRYQTEEKVVLLKGQWIDQHFAFENNEQFIIDLKKPMNVGFFLDMGKGREYLRHNSAGKRVLNLFSYTCSLSVSALKGSALEVVNVDMNKSYLEKGKINHEINGLLNKAKFIPYDIMKSFANLKRMGPFDLVIIDPPMNQGKHFTLERDYKKILRHLDQLVEDDGKVMATLNSPHHDQSYLKIFFLEFAPNFIFEELMHSSFSDMEQNIEQGLKIFIFKKQGPLISS